MIMKLLVNRLKEAKAKVAEQENVMLVFVYVENADRSQIAETFFRKYAPAGYLATSVWICPTGEIKPVVVQ
jgi:arsenate reductase (thioredoxin)